MCVCFAQRTFTHCVTIEQPAALDMLNCCLFDNAGGANVVGVTVVYADHHNLIMLIINVTLLAVVNGVCVCNRVTV